MVKRYPSDLKKYILQRIDHTFVFLTFPCSFYFFFYSVCIQNEILIYGMGLTNKPLIHNKPTTAIATLNYTVTTRNQF